MGLILEEQEPRLAYAVNVNVDLNGAGIDLLRFVKLIEFAVGSEILNSNRCNIHKADGLSSAKLLADADVLVIGLLKQLILELNVINNGQEGGVTAVIRPVCIDHTYLGDGRLASFRLKVILTEGDIVGVHSQAVLLDKLLEAFFVQRKEAVKGSYGSRDLIVSLEGLRLLESRLTRFNRVDDILLDLSNIIGRKVAVKGIHLCGTDDRSLKLRDDLDALSGTVSALIKLTGQKLNRKCSRTAQINITRCNIKLRLGEYRFYSVIEQVFGDILSIIAVEDADIGKVFDTKKITGIGAQRLCFIGKFPFLFNKYSINHFYSSKAFRALAPISCLK